MVSSDQPARPAVADLQPAYRQVTLHDARLVGGGGKADRADPGAVQVRPEGRNGRERFGGQGGALRSEERGGLRPAPCATALVPRPRRHRGPQRRPRPRPDGLSAATDGPATFTEADAPFWLPARQAAQDYLRLLTERPERIRACGNPECIPHFYDVSKNGTRRWCSMAGCGNRASGEVTPPRPSRPLGTAPCNYASAPPR
ncbi:CGNR zinc finger domain-containing protein [Streptomyces flaveolus]|uniref:CGNR zinc finger domain-containing protein n=1 Tax=Streptomyces flaveolus TaxID=67297 RepID=UPI0036FC71D2